MAWTKERLEEITRTRLVDAKRIVVANREPFMHVYDGETIECMKPASGLTTDGTHSSKSQQNIG